LLKKREGLPLNSKNSNVRQQMGKVVSANNNQGTEKDRKAKMLHQNQQEIKKNPKDLLLQRNNRWKDLLLHKTKLCGAK
jgi:hypothetical protein